MEASLKSSAGTTEPESAEHLSWRWRVLISTYFGYAGYYLTRNVFASCKVPLETHFDRGAQDIAHLWSVYLVAYLLGQLLVSSFGRRTSARVLLLVGLGTSIVINLLFGATNSYSTFMLLMFLNGLAQAAGWPGCIGAVARWLLPRHRASVMGVWSTNLLLGDMMVLAISSMLLAKKGWSYAFWGCSLLALIPWLLLLFWQRDHPEDVDLPPLVDEPHGDGRVVLVSDGPHLPLSEYIRLASSPVVMLMAAGYFFIKFLRYSITSWLPKFFNEMGLTSSESAFYSILPHLVGFLGMSLAGWMAIRWLRGSWATMCLVGGLGAALGYYFVMRKVPGPVAFACWFGLIGFMVNGADSLLKGVACLEVAGRGNGPAVVGFVNGIASIAPVIQEELIGYWMGDKVPGRAIQRAMGLGFVMSLFFILIMGAVIWRIRRGGGTRVAPRAGLQS